MSINADGCLVIDAPTVCALPLTTNDIAEIAADGRRFRIRGRKLRPYINVPFLISKRSDPKFGETVVMIAETNDIESLKTICKERLNKYEQPHKYIAVDSIPTTETGKPARAKAMEIAQTH